MSYNLNPLSEEELNAFDLVEEGIYDFEVLKSERQTSKSGNPMAKLQLNVWDKSGRISFVFDYLVFSSVKFCTRKVKHFCDSVGIADDYLKGTIREELEGLSGKVSIGIQESMPNPTGGYYPSKNVVIDYVTKDNASQMNVGQQQVAEPEFNDQIPF
jgi:hypothetical protein